MGCGQAEQAGRGPLAHGPPLAGMQTLVSPLWLYRAPWEGRVHPGRQHSQTVEKRQVGESALLCVGVPGGAGNVGSGRLRLGRGALMPSLPSKAGSLLLRMEPLPFGSPGPVRSGEHGGAHGWDHPGLWGAGQRSLVQYPGSGTKGHGGPAVHQAHAGHWTSWALPFLLLASRAQCGGPGALGSCGARGSSCPV